MSITTPEIGNDGAYAVHDFGVFAGRIGAAGVRAMGEMQQGMVTAAELSGLLPTAVADLSRRAIGAGVEVTDRLTREFPKPEFGLEYTEIDGEQVAVHEEIVDGQDKAFGSLLHFKRETERDDPPLLILAPMSGHYATLLRDTVWQALPAHDVYITDWKNVRDIPLLEGKFDLSNYIDYVRGFIKTIGSEVNVLAVCQSTVPGLAAVAYMAETEPEMVPQTLTLMGGPIDTRAAPTVVTELADKYPLEWFKQNMVTTVPSYYQGKGRKAFAGHDQLRNFRLMNPDMHVASYIKLMGHLMSGDQTAAGKFELFDNEYQATCDSAGEYYIDTIDQSFQRHTLPRGLMEHDGRLVNLAAIVATAILTVEGAKDKISAPGQTSAVHDLLKSLPPDMRAHYLQPGVGHYGIFSGRQWGAEIAPRIAGFIREKAAAKGRFYSPVSETEKIIMPVSMQAAA